MEIDTAHLHHAYLLIGNKGSAKTFFVELFSKLNINPDNNPDLYYFVENPFGIDNARRLKSLAEAKAFGNKKIFIINSPLMTLEAQNALLKVFEEPTANTHFFIVNKKNLLIPTLVSRLVTIRLPDSEEEALEAETFLASTVPERLEYIKSLGKTDDFSLSDFLENMLSILKLKNLDSKELGRVFNLTKFSSDPAANTRLILEHLALTLGESLE